MVADRCILFFMSFILLSGTLCAVGSSKEYEDHLREIRSAFQEKMQKEFSLHCYGEFDVLNETVEALGMKFIAHRRATVQEARALELLLIEQFVNAINVHEKIQPYLAENPFTHKRVSIAIDFVSPNGAPYTDRSVAHIFHGSEACSSKYRNHLVYQAADPLIERPIITLRESFEEAVQLNTVSPVENPAVHQMTDKEEAIDSILNLFTDKISEEYGVSCWPVGGRMANDIKDIAVKITACQPATRENARQLLVEVAEKLLLAVNHNEKLKPYLADYPFTADRLRILLCFRNERLNSYVDGISMENVKLQKGKITFFQTSYFNEEGEKKVFPDTKVIGNETYSEAKWIVEKSPQPKKNYRASTPSLFDILSHWFRIFYGYLFSS